MGFFLWRPQIFKLNFVLIHQIVVEKFHSGKCWLTAVRVWQTTCDGFYFTSWCIMTSLLKTNAAFQTSYFRHTEKSQMSVDSSFFRPCSGPVWRCTASGRSPGTDSHHTRGPRWRRPPPGRWGRGSSACRCRRRGAPPPGCTEGRTSSAPPDWRAGEEVGEEVNK